MSDNQDPLNQLWQQQEVVQSDLLAVSNKWHKVRFKQWCYVVLDMLSIVIPCIFLWLNANKFDGFTLVLISGLMFVSVIFVAYITWLRRFSFGWSNMSTDQHIQKLQKQIANNIKIADLSLHSVWGAAALMVFFYAGLYYFEVFPIDKFIHKLTITMAINIVALPGIWIWASKRKKRFTKELSELNHLLAGNKV